MAFLSGRTSLTTVQTGDIATGAITTALIAANNIDSTLTKDALIADYTEVTIATGDSLLLGDVGDSGNTKRDTVQGLLDLAGGGFTLATEQSTDIDPTSSVTFGSIPAGTTMIVMMLEGVKTGGTQDMLVRIGDSGGIETSGYLGAGGSMHATGYTESRTDGYGIILNAETHDLHNGSVILTLKDSSNFTWTATGIAGSSSNNQRTHACGGSKSLTAELTQVQFISLDVLQGGSINIMYQ